MILLFDYTHDPDPGVEISRPKSEIALLQEWYGRITWNEKYVSHSFMTMILTSVTMVGWVMYRIVTGVTSDVSVPWTYLVLYNVIMYHVMTKIRMLQNIFVVILYDVILSCFDYHLW